MVRPNKKLILIKSIHYKNSNILRLLDMVNYFLRVLINNQIRETNANLIIADSVHPFGALGALCIAHFKGCNYIYQIRDIWPDALRHEGKLSKLNPAYWIFKGIENICINQSTLIISSLKDYSRYLDKKNVYKKVLWVPNPIQSFYKNQAHQKPFKVIYLGGFGYSHDVQSILSIIRKNAKHYLRNSIKFYFFGQGVRLKETLAYASKHKLQNALKVCKFKKAANIISILKKSSLAIASLNKNEVYQYGINLNKINTYFSCGIPFLLHGGCAENEFSSGKLGMRMTSQSCEELSKNIDSFFQIKVKEYRNISRNIISYAIKTRSLSALQKKIFLEINELIK
jgi:hypothetical protein